MENTRQGVSDKMAVAVNAGATCLGCYIMAFIYGPLMALISCLVVPMMILVGVQMSFVSNLKNEFELLLPYLLHDVIDGDQMTLLESERFLNRYTFIKK